MVGRISLPFVFLVDFRQPVVVLFEELSALHVAVWSTAETGRVMSEGWDRNSRPFSDTESTLKMTHLLFWIPLPILIVRTSIPSSHACLMNVLQVSRLW